MPLLAAGVLVNGVRNPGLDNEEPTGSRSSGAPRPRAPRASLLVRASLWLHVAAVVVLVLAPGRWLALALILFADHCLLAIVGMLPRSRLLGPNLRGFHPPGAGARAPRAAFDDLPSSGGPSGGRSSGGGQAIPEMVALTFDDGPDPEVTPRVLEMLDRAGARATFFVIGNRAARHPELVQEIVAAGHVLGNHTWTHSPAFSMFTPGQIARELDATQELLAQIAGTRPRLFRAPAGVRGPFLQLMLPPRELLMVSWTRRGFDAVTTRAAGVHRRLVRGLSSGDILLLHDGQSRWMYRRRLASGAPPVVLEVLPGVLASLQSQGLRSGALGTDIPLDQLV